MEYSVPFEDQATGTTDNVYKTLVSLENPASGGIRHRIKKVVFNPSDDAPGDRNFGVRIHRKADLTLGVALVGTAISAANVPKGDPSSRDTAVVVKRVVTTEPTSLETEAWFQEGSNDRNGAVYEFNADPSREEGRANANMGNYLQFCPRGATATRISGTVFFEEF
jgi:hypothetical protein